MVDIIIATYNGEKYVGQQLLSIMAQTYGDWRCIIHDDGSTDDTVNIVKSFCQKDSRITIVEDGIALHSAAQNFMHTLQYSHSDFVCFCDQDDVWFDNKIEVLHKAISQKDNTIPQVVFSNSYVYEYPSNKITGKATLAFPRKLEEFFFLNAGVQGAAGIFNSKMREVLSRPLKPLAMHDYYLTLSGICLGNIDYVDDCLMLYRNHSSNVTGATDPSLMFKVRSMLSRKDISVVSRDHLKTAEAFYEEWKDVLKKDDLKLFEAYFMMEQKSFFVRLRMVLKNKFSIYGSTPILLAKICMRRYI